ncbi:MAG: 50S ribosomal protein L34e [Promethearchaeota archaeon]|nr:MAG: 50S ribosomal protein L34e [Candidatus Lokiarchaeota archaeon]
MPRPGLRSRAQKRKKIRTPGNRNVVHYWRRKPKKSHCAICKKPLPSIPKLRPSKMKKTDKITRRPNRLESGRYCGKCLQDLIKQSVWTQ